MFNEDDTISTHGEKLRTTDIGGGGYRKDGGETLYKGRW